MRRSFPLLLALLAPVALEAQATTTSVTPHGDTVVVTAETIIKSVSVKVKPDTVPAPYPVPGPTVTDTLFCDAQLACSKVRPVPVVVPIPTPVVIYPFGKPFGPVSAYSSYTAINPGPWTLTFQSSAAGGILAQIDAARARKMKLVLALTGGAHASYMTNGVFDRKKWDAKMQTYNTTAIRDAIAKGVADGTIIGASVMDEPHVSGSGDGNTWGPVGTMTKVRVDSLCRSVKTIFPTLPAGAAHRWDIFEPAKSYQNCDFILSQYTSRLGSVTAYRDGALALAQRDKLAILFSVNILDGGAQDRDGTWDCQGTGGIGTYTPNCRVTPAQLREFGTALLAAPSCGLLMWQYNQAFVEKPENAAVLTELATLAAKQPAPPCKRP